MMPDADKNRNWLTAALLYLSPFVVVITVDLFVIHRSYSSFPNDALPGMLGLGLGWFTGAPLTLFHIPGDAFNEISALILWAVGPPQTTLKLFNQWGVGVQIVLAVLMAAWAGSISVRLRLSAVLVVLLGAITATMPTMVLYATIWTMYFPLGLLIVPISLHFYAALTDGEPRRGANFLALCALGFLCANIFTGLVLALAVVFACIAATSKLTELGELFSAAPGNGALRYALKVLTLTAVIIALIGLVRPVPLIGREAWAWIVALAAATTIVLAMRWARIPDLVVSGIVVPLLIGWIVGANFLLPWWFRAAYHAYRTKGGAAPHYSAGELLSRLDPVGYLTSWSWHWLLLVTAVVGTLAAVAAGREKGASARIARFVAAFSLGALVLNIMVAVDVTLASPSFRPELFGQTSRYYLTAVGPIAVVIVWASSAGLYRSGIVLALAALICASSFADYWRVTPPIVAEQVQTTRILDQLVDAHLAENSLNAVVCARTVLPDRCAVLYGYNNYRSPESLRILDRTEAASGRIIYVDDAQIVGGTGKVLEAIGNRWNKVMVIRETASADAAPEAPIWSNSRITVEVINGPALR
jgi:hypothetical protein